MGTYRNQTDYMWDRPLEDPGEHRPNNFVTPAAAPIVKQINPPQLPQTPTITVDAVFAPGNGAIEHTSAMDRARALRVRLVPFLVAWGVLSAFVGGVAMMVAQNAPAAALSSLLVFSALTAFTYYRLNRTDYDYSREGTERHRLDTAADLATQQMAHEYELRKLALLSYLKVLGVDDDRG